MSRSSSFLPCLVMGTALGVAVACSGESGQSDGPDDDSSAGESTTGGISSGGATSTGGASPGGSATTGGSSPSGGEGNASGAGGDAGSSAGGTSSGNSGLGGEAGGGSGGTGGAGATNGGTGGRGGTAGSTTGGFAGERASLSFVPSAESLSTGVRYYTGSTPANRTSGPAQGPTQTLRIHNLGLASGSITASVSGADAARFEIVTPSSFPVSIAPGGNADVTLRLVTANTTLGTAPAQDDGATVLRATLDVTGGPSARLYALVLTYVELEPTFGQILDAFPYYTSNLPNSLRNDANPNPATLPGVEAGTDEVNAPRFRRANATAPVTLRALARFSPPGLVPFGWYSPGNIAARTSVGTLGQTTDPHTNDKSRMLLPPLASGGTEFSPSAEPFGLWMAPAGVGLLASDDDDGFDGAHRMKIWTLRDASGAVRPNEYLVGGEEAANGDYQDYVFVVTNVVPVP